MQIENSQDKYLLLEPFVAPSCAIGLWYAVGHNYLAAGQ
jgi:hypothetical protein